MKLHLFDAVRLSEEHQNVKAHMAIGARQGDSVEQITPWVVCRDFLKDDLVSAALVDDGALGPDWSDNIYGYRVLNPRFTRLYDPDNTVLLVKGADAWKIPRNKHALRMLSWLTGWPEVTISERISDPVFDSNVSELGYDSSCDSSKVASMYDVYTNISFGSTGTYVIDVPREVARSGTALWLFTLWIRFCAWKPNMRKLSKNWAAFVAESGLFSNEARLPLALFHQMDQVHRYAHMMAMTALEYDPADDEDFIHYVHGSLGLSGMMSHCNYIFSVKRGRYALSRPPRVRREQFGLKLLGIV